MMRSRIFLFVFLFVTFLVGAVFVTQYSSNNNIVNLQKGILTAVRTFQVNSLLQEMVNEVNLLDLKVRKQMLGAGKQEDSLLAEKMNLISSNLSSLQQLTQDYDRRADIDTLSHLLNLKLKFTDSLMAHSSQYLPASETALKELVTGGTKERERIYDLALRIQQNLEINLQNTLAENNRLSAKALRLSRMLSVVAIMAIVVLGTMIVNRIFRQVALIRQLSDAQKKTEKLSKAKDQFLANMSHELRTPVTAMIGFTNLLQKSSVGTRQAEMIKAMSASGEMLLSLINDVLDIARIEEGKLRLNPRAFHLGEMLDSIRQIFEHRAQEKGLALVFDLDPKAPDWVMGDPDRVKQILFNLMSNAIKFTDKGSITTSIRLIEKTGNRVQIEFVMTDTGIGIPQEKQMAVFSRFEQVDTELRRSAGGAGLGLSIVNSLVQLMNGTIALQSKPGAGSAFRVSIPFTLLSMQPMPLPAYGPKLSDPLPDWPPHCKVLVAEDNKINQLLLQHYFEEWQLDGVFVENGQQVIDLLQAKDDAFSLVLMDIQMPVMDGFEATQWIRKHVSWPLPVIALSAYAPAQWQQLEATYGFNDYLTKPFSQQELYDQLKKHLHYQPSEIPGASSEFIDIAFLNQNFDNNADFIERLLAQFERQVSSELADLQMAIAGRHESDARHIIHKMITTITSVSPKSPLHTSLMQISSLIIAGKPWAEVESALEIFAGMVNEAKLTAIAALKTYKAKTEVSPGLRMV